VDNELTLAFTAPPPPAYSVAEGGGAATIAVELTGVNATPVTVNWSTSNGTAQAGADYGPRGSATPPSGMLTFAAGGTPTTVRTRTFTVPILQDALVEGPETVTLALSGPAGAQLVAGRDTAVLSIVDDDAGGTIRFAAAVYTAAENAGTATITVARTGSTAGGATVDFATGDGTATAAADYTGTSGTLAHTASVTLVVNVLPSFALSVNPSSRTVKRGRSTPYTVTVSSQGGFAGTVTLSSSGLPTGATATFAPSSVVAPGSSTMTVKTTGKTPRGTFVLTVTGTSGAIVSQSTTTLIVA